jgi:rRNA maturation endonuclease Nob1
MADKKNIEEIVDPHPICKKCFSKFTYVRLKTSESVCRNCGNIEKIEEKYETNKTK